jgi:hypothetical protein
MDVPNLRENSPSTIITTDMRGKLILFMFDLQIFIGLRIDKYTGVEIR